MDEEMQATIDEIVKHGKTIGAMSEKDELSRKVIQYYDMFYRCKEPGSFVLLDDAFKKWKAANASLIAT